MEGESTEKTIYTVTANCQDCYRCVRACPVKAIKVSDGQAKVLDQLCIKCGTCVRECPQGAKIIRSDIDEVRALLQKEAPVVASVAPSFPAAFSGSYAKRLPSALRQLGFAHVSETAEGAQHVAIESVKDSDARTICTACPAVVNYIEKYRPHLVGDLLHVVSPMVGHGRLLKRNYPGCAVVFIGPCAAKKEEAMRPENKGAVDVVLTFAELDQWLEQEGISLANCIESEFETADATMESRLFPLQGGLLMTGGLTLDDKDPNVLHLSGADEVIAFLDSYERDTDYRCVEALFCKGGCIGGPGFPEHKSIFDRRKDVMEYAGRKHLAFAERQHKDVTYAAEFFKRPVSAYQVTEAQINEILEQTGKADPRLQLNCGACGYQNCIENAIAVAMGMAEPEMCMPYTRRLAQQRTDKIIETSPNGIVVLDSDLCIIKMNPAFHEMFRCNNGIIGRRISYLMNSEGFERLLTKAVERYESIRTAQDMRYHEILYALPAEDQYIGIYSDISRLKFDASQLDVIKSQTLKHAQEFLDHQIRFSQEMAHYLGKSTAQSEEIARRLMSLYEESKERGELS